MPNRGDGGGFVHLTLAGFTSNTEWNVRVTGGQQAQQPQQRRPAKIVPMLVKE